MKTALVRLDLGKLLRRSTAVLFVSLLAQPFAHADEAYSFSYSGDGVTASGIFMTGAYSDDVDGVQGLAGWEITGIEGTRNGVAITGLWDNPNGFDPTTVGDVEFDNVLLAQSLTLDYFGLAYTLANGEAVNVYSQDYPVGGGYFDWVDGSGAFIPVSLDPEPCPDNADTALLLVLGFALCASASLYWKRGVRSLF